MLQLPISAAFYSTTSINTTIIFAIVITSSNLQLNSNSNFIVYYRSKLTDPFVCWNSCIPTKITDANYKK